MSRILVTIDTDNDAFQDNGWRQEAAHVLVQLAARSASNRNRDTTGTLRDTDGADCGAWDYNADEPLAS
jgi:phosphoribosylformimino-5-aminoimidazole carboxamide ribonucleotide (ProFAR) isomerase